jgi:hypothetical protein
MEGGVSDAVSLVGEPPFLPKPIELLLCTQERGLADIG